MLHSLSQRIAAIFLSESRLAGNSYKTYVYGTELILSSLFSLLAIFFVSTLLGCLGYAVLFLLSFITLRRYTGGLHCKSYLKCNCLSVLVCLLCISVARISEYLSVSGIMLMIVSVLTLIIIAVFSPIENHNKKIELPNRKKLKFGAVEMYLLHLLLFVSIKKFDVFNADVIIVTDFAVAISMLAGIKSSKSN